MKTKILIAFSLICLALTAQAKKYPEIKFETTTIDMGKFSMDDPIQKAEFTFTNTGSAKLIINMVHASCGCTVAEFPKDPIAPGATGVIKVTYNGTGKMPAPFTKNIQVFTNCKDDMTRIYIKGEMTDVPVSKKTQKK